MNQKQWSQDQARIYGSHPWQNVHLKRAAWARKQTNEHYAFSAFDACHRSHKSTNTVFMFRLSKKELRLKCNKHQILQILSISLFEKVPIQQALTSIVPQNEKVSSPNQLVLFNL